MAVNGHGGGRPGGSSIKVIARLPALDAEREAPPEREPETSRLPPPPARAVEESGRAPANEPQRFPLHSVVTLALVAAITWTAALWNDRQRVHAERVAEAQREQQALEQRPHRLAREGTSPR
ncbi:MAG: hypothetical protein ACK54F_04220 [Planctomycetia bacterium]|jgi:hypothetical protein